ncbi:MAG: DedA family protein [Anaerovibrio sp.]|uniref:DedA family protein n=1 Tax=Anaerovibrio sp. TaxID=1872532 RepID=UPI0026012C7A|nr:DedA family protein [Anaerovibrio sp.]MCR5175243.1 DedA family protein [Anaerovibrio sp.]
MSQFADVFLQFIDTWGYFAVALLMGFENACIPIPSELILGFAGYMIYIDRMTFLMATTAGMIGGMLGSVFAYYVGHLGGRPFVDKYGKYFFVKASHVDIAQEWFDKYGIKAVFFSRMLPVVRTFISLPAGFAHVNMRKFFFYTFIGSLPWTILILAIGYTLGEGWRVMMEVGHEISIIFCIILVVVVAVLYLRYRRKKKNKLN